MVVIALKARTVWGASGFATRFHEAHHMWIHSVFHQPQQQQNTTVSGYIIRSWNGKANIIIISDPRNGDGTTLMVNTCLSLPTNRLHPQNSWRSSTVATRTTATAVDVHVGNMAYPVHMFVENVAEWAAPTHSVQIWISTLMTPSQPIRYGTVFVNGFVCVYIIINPTWPLPCLDGTGVPIISWLCYHKTIS